MIRIPSAWIEWFDLPRALAWIAVVGGGYGYFVWRTVERGDAPGGLPPIGLLVAAPFVAGALAPALVALLPAYAQWVAERTWTPWQGIYHAFDDQQIRVVEARDRLWFASDDVHQALSMRRRAAVLQAMTTGERRDDADAGLMLSHAGLLRLLGKSTDRRALRLLAWANGVCRVHAKKRDMQPAHPSPTPDRPPSSGSARS